MTAHDIEPQHYRPAAGTGHAYERLPPRAARLFRLLAWHPGRDFPAGLAAALLGGADGETSALLAELTAAGVVTAEDPETGAARWRMDDRASLDAQRLAEERPGEGRRAVAVICRWYLDAAVAADRVAAPALWRRGGRYLAIKPGDFRDAAAAVDWLGEQLPTLVAVVRLAHSSGRHKDVWQLCEALSGVLEIRRPYRVWVETHTLGLEAARLLGDTQAQVCMLLQLGRARLLLGDRGTAEAMVREALGLARVRGDRPAEADALHRLGQVSLRARRPEQAIRQGREAAAIYRDLGLIDSVGHVLLHIGDAHRQAGDHADAVQTLTNAAAALRGTGTPYDELRISLVRAHTDLDSGQSSLARRQLDRALARACELGAPAEQAHAYELLARLIDHAVRDGQAGNTAAQKQAAYAHLRAARDLYTELGDHAAAARLDT